MATVLLEGATSDISSPSTARKWCPACCTNRAADDFGFDRSRGDGLSGWCRNCRALGEKTRRDAHLDDVRRNLRERYRCDPARFKAHVAVARAVAAGELVKPSSCPACFRYRPVEAHHYLGYAREHWLDVVWRCRQCHSLEHKRGDVLVHAATIGPLHRITQHVATNRVSSLMSVLVLMAALMMGCASPTAPRGFAPSHPCNDCRTPADTSTKLGR